MPTLGSAARLPCGNVFLVNTPVDDSTLGTRGTVEDCGLCNLLLETDSIEVGVTVGTAAERCKSLVIRSRVPYFRYGWLIIK